ncbi:ABC transporter permease [Conexibacter woesei]|uniref:Binding-protein-dependent transport systems inner membrane component n=1 Tax=Conexibacter woesei (strain DSM 14684 / CCUG 47730 / CIP 108061 / JCM 11494 / NBRC 100937 / ID131577) TaxID=469383 RepID=D3F2G9_CONWI|nr:ABC transporter permease [Conexibacter woesei]ADB52235.1 binding-protein-dependent transport systems inner membrane component [Conexibacter woesei DSM 14684]
MKPIENIEIEQSGGSAAVGRRSRAGRSLLATAAIRASVPLALLGLWQLAAALDLIDTTLVPPPSEVASAFWDLLTSGRLADALAISLTRCALGLLIGIPVGLALGIAAGLFKLGEELVDATMQALRTVPFVSLIPLFILWLGIGDTSKIALIAFGVTFPVYMNTYAGIRGVDAKLIEAAEVFGLNRRQLVRQVVVPGALPSILVGLRYALGLSVIALVVSETVNANNGIGALVSDARQFLQTEVVLVGILVYSALGLIGDGAIRLLERRLLSWRGSFRGA